MERWKEHQRTHITQENSVNGPVAPTPRIYTIFRYQKTIKGNELPKHYDSMASFLLTVLLAK